MTRRNWTDALDGFDMFDDLLRIIVVPSSAITLFQIKVEARNDGRFDAMTTRAVGQCGYPQP